MADETNLSAAPTSGEKETRIRMMGLFLFPIALFPLLALISYSWESLPSLRFPAEPSRNLIGAAGDLFASTGYAVAGLGVWAVPPLCALLGLMLVLGRRPRVGRRFWAFCLLMLTCTCLLQLLGRTAPVRQLTDALNITPNAGGAIGFLLMDCCMARLVSPFGAAVLMASLAVFALLMLVGVRNLLAAIGGFLGGGRPLSPEELAERARRAQEKENQIRAAQLAREEAHRQKQAEKERIAAEKRAEKERLAAEKQAAKDRLAAERLAEESRAATQLQAPAERAAPNARAAAVRTPADAAAQSAKPQPGPAAADAPAAEPEDKGPYVLPPLALLDPPKVSTADHGDVEAISGKLVETLKLFDVDAQLAYTRKGPTVTLYALSLAPGTKPEKITSLENTLKMATKAKTLRILAPIPGEDAVGVEVPNKSAAAVSFREIIDSETWAKATALDRRGQAKYNLPLLLGKDAAGNDLIADLATMPHMLVAGATGQGKSVCLNSIINGLLMTRTPEQLKLIMVDPKCVEFTSYASLPHLLVPVVTDTKKVVYSLRWAVAEMEKRLKMFARAGKRNIVDFNTREVITQPDMFGGEEQGDDMPRTIPYIVIIIDEVADLMASAGKDVEPEIARITAKARAAGIHVILATQRPDTKTITGTIKSNIPGRIAFKTSSSIDSRTILDETGAEGLVGRGDMLFRTKEGMLIRAQGAWVSDSEIGRITDFIAEHANVQFDTAFASKLAKVKEVAGADPFADNEDDPDNQPPAEASGASGGGTTDEKDEQQYRKALEVVALTRRASISHLQRKMNIGYNHAARLIDLLEERGVIGPAHGAGPREVLIDPSAISANTGGGVPSSAPDTSGGADGDAFSETPTQEETETNYGIGTDPEIGA